MRQRWMQHLRSFSLVVAFALLLCGHGSALAATPGHAVDVDAPAGAAVVAAQLVVDFGSGPSMIQVVNEAAVAIPGEMQLPAPGFGVVRTGALHLTGEDAEFAIGTGEAAGLPVGPYQMESLDPFATLDWRLIVIAPNAYSGSRFTGTPIANLQGKHEVELWIVSLRPGDTASFQGAAGPMLVLALDEGVGTVDGQSGQSGSLNAGDAGEFLGPLELSNGGSAPARAAVIAIGPPLGTSSGQSPTPTPGSAFQAPVTQVQQQPAQPQQESQPPTPTPPTAPEAPTPTPTEETMVDTDSDGLSDTDEVALGTDPNNQDSDGDGLPDGREVNALGSNPLDTDTDSDGLTDALEVDHSSDINAPDTDGDGLGDAFEANSGFSEPSLADTDGDGDDDLAEFSIGTDPRDPNCFSGPGSVCQN